MFLIGSIDEEIDSKSNDILSYNSKFWLGIN